LRPSRFDRDRVLDMLPVVHEGPLHVFCASTHMNTRSYSEEV
jgi:hypothetical protein